MNKPIEISGVITEKDFLFFNYLVFRKRMRFFIWMFVLSFIVSVSDLLAIVLHSPAEGLSSIFKEGHTYLLAFLFLPLFMVIAIYFSAKRAYRNDTLISKKRSYVLDEEGVSCTNPNSNTRVSWTDVKSFVDNKKMMLISLSNRQTLPIPGSFMDAEQQVQIRALLNSKIKKEKSRYMRWLIPAGIILAALFCTPLIQTIFPASENKAMRLYEEGKKKEQAGDYKAAILLFDQTIKEDPQFASAYNLRGFSKGQLGNATGELEDCSKAAALDTAYADAYLSVGYAKCALGDSLGACEAFHKASDLGDEDAKTAIKENCVQ